MKKDHLTPHTRLIADIGGTNARFALVDSDNSEITGIRTLKCKDYPTLATAAKSFLASSGASYPQEAVIAVACPTQTDKIVLTNNHWSFSQIEVQQELRLEKLLAINDFTAQALSIPQLKKNEFITVVEGTPIAGKPIALVGPGTGLGVGGLVPSGEQWIPIETEGGHVNFAPVDELEIKVLQILFNRFGRVSFERILSGPGLVHLYRAVAELNGCKSDQLISAEITQKALAKTCDLCQQTLRLFCEILGSFAGNLALTFGSLGGVYITGGIVPRFIDYLKKTRFTERFKNKGRISYFIQDTPIYVITAENPGLIGAAAQPIYSC